MYIYSILSFSYAYMVLIIIKANIAAIGMLLPSLATHNKIWCGGDGQYIEPTYALTGTEAFSPSQITSSSAAALALSKVHFII